MAKTIPLPGYRTTKPQLPAIKLMLKELGAQDACIQLQELSIIFMRNSAHATKAPLDEFLNLLYAANQIPQGTHDFSELRELVYGSYIIVTYALFEKMVMETIVQLKANKPALAGAWNSKSSAGGGLPPLRELTQNLPSGVRTLLESAPEFRLFEYYRAVRVANSHIKGSTSANVGTAFAALTNADMQHFYTCYGLNGPNLPPNISFDDFMLFTRAIKYYSRLINEACA